MPPEPQRLDRGLCIVLLWPELLGTYGDGGNARVLQQRCAWRGIPAEVVSVSPGQPVPAGGDIYLLGGGEDAAQTAALAEEGAAGVLTRAAAAGAVVFGVCAGFQLLGEWFTDGAGRQVAGLGLLDARTDRLRRRAVGEIVVEPEAFPGLGPLTGFENHGGRTTIGAGARPLGRVTVGVGNGTDDVEGAVAGSVVATYLHGPVLARNPALADLLLERVAGPLGPLSDPDDDALVERLRDERLAAVPHATPRHRLGFRRAARTPQAR